MLLREFLYVDADKVRGLLAQLDGGIVENTAVSDKLEKLTGGGVKGFAEHSQRSGSERTSQKSQGDALFPTLEEALDSLGMLRDVSEELLNTDFWDTETLRSELPPGSLVRITAPASLFDARYVASTLSAFATTWLGLANIDAVTPAKAPQQKTVKGQQGQQASRKGSLEPRSEQLEDAIPDEGVLFGGESETDAISREFLRGIVRVSRGVFTPGLHLSMRPTGNATHAVSARLQEGRQFLDGEPDVLFARYGAGAQEWTLVGSVGHHGEVVDGDFSSLNLVDDDNNMNRSVFLEMVNKLTGHLGTLGFVDLPQAPGFSVVPLAVYRVIGTMSATGGSVDATEGRPV